MKIPPLSIIRRCCAASIGLSAALAFALGGCSSNDTVEVQPSAPGGPSAPGSPAGSPPPPDNTDTYGLPGPEPVSDPPENDGPGATETNFLTPPCRLDSDCPDARRCIAGARVLGQRDAGADAGDAGLASDAGIEVGRCEPIDGG
jgi:hypothetical protein